MKNNRTHVLHEQVHVKVNSPGTMNCATTNAFFVIADIEINHTHL